MRYAAILRIDHMPNFHRVFWIPPGSDPTQGAYVRYPHEALLDVLADLVTRPVFAPLDIEREQKVVLEEIKMV